MTCFFKSPSCHQFYYLIIYQQVKMLIMNFHYYPVFSIHGVFVCLTNFSELFHCIFPGTLQVSLLHTYTRVALRFSTQISWRCSISVDQRKQVSFQWSCDPSPVHVHNLNNVRCETSRHFSTKHRNRWKPKSMELETKSKNIRFPQYF